MVCAGTDVAAHERLIVHQCLSPPRCERKRETRAQPALFLPFQEGEDLYDNSNQVSYSICAPISAKFYFNTKPNSGMFQKRAKAN